MPSFLTHYVNITHVNLTTNKTTRTLGGHLPFSPRPLPLGEEARGRRKVGGDDILRVGRLSLVVGWRSRSVLVDGEEGRGKERFPARSVVGSGGSTVPSSHSQSSADDSFAN